MIYLCGAGGHAKVVLEILEAQKLSTIEIIDEYKEGTVNDLPISGKSIPGKIEATDQVIIAIGNNQVRKYISEKYQSVKYINVIHPSSNVSPRVILGEGSVIMAGVSINADTIIGKHSILNTNCSVDHDNKIGSFVHISPNVALAGNVQVGDGTHIGIGACVIQGIRIGKWATIGAGAVIVKDIPDYAVVVGNPGKIIKYHSTNIEEI
jgi:acetyltransferase EpsM